MQPDVPHTTPGCQVVVLFVPPTQTDHHGQQSISGVARRGLGAQTPSIRIEAVFVTAVKLLLLNIITSLTTRRTFNSHDLRKTNLWGLGAGVYCPPIDTILW